MHMFYSLYKLHLCKLSRSMLNHWMLYLVALCWLPLTTLNFRQPSHSSHWTSCGEDILVSCAMLAWFCKSLWSFSLPIWRKLVYLSFQGYISLVIGAYNPSSEVDSFPSNANLSISPPTLIFSNFEQILLHQLCLLLWISKYTALFLHFSIQVLKHSPNEKENNTLLPPKPDFPTHFHPFNSSPLKSNSLKWIPHQCCTTTHILSSEQCGISKARAQKYQRVHYRVFMQNSKIRQCTRKLFQLKNSCKFCVILKNAIIFRITFMRVDCCLYVYRH